MALNVHCTLNLFERKRRRDLGQMSSIQSNGEVTVQIAFFHDLPHNGTNFQAEGVLSKKT